MDRSSSVEKVRTGENVYAIRTEHLRSCALVQAGAKRLVLPESQCSCGATWSTMAREVHVGANIVTDAGDEHYAHLAAGEATPYFTAPDMSLTTAQNAPSKTSDFSDLTTIPSGGTKDIDGSYPQTDDADADNPGTTGVDIATFRTSYGTSEANGTIIGVAIHESGASGTDELLMHAAFASSFAKTSADTLKAYVNHRFNGV